MARGVYFRTEKNGTPLATPELRISATNNRTVYYDNQNAKEAALQSGEIKEGSIVLTGYADGESEVVIKQELDWERVQSFTAQQLFDEYTAPEDGVVYITGRCAAATASWITINHQKVGYYFGGSGSIIDCQVDSQINKGDVITSSNLLTADYSGIFVPFKTVAEPLTLPVNLVPEKDKYSYTEIKTNKTWVDGKPIYRKVVSLPTTKSINDNAYIDLGITFPSNADTMFLPEAVSVYGNLIYYNNYKPIRAACKVDVILPAGTNFILEYTKN